MKESKISTTKTRELKKSNIEEQENIKVMEVIEDADIDSDIAATTKKRR